MTRSIVSKRRRRRRRGKSKGAIAASIRRGLQQAIDYAEIIPNAVTIAAMEEARRGNLETVPLDDLMAELNSDD